MGRPPKILVTGLQHSGTTYLMQLIDACGWDIGHPLHTMDERKGLEWTPFFELATDVGEALGRAGEPIGRDWNRIRFRSADEVRRRFKDRLEALDFPSAVKCPDNGQHVLLSDLKAGHVVFMVRSLGEWMLSMLGNPHARGSMSQSDLFHSGARGMGLLLDAVETQDIPYTIVSYPRVAAERGYAWEKLGPLLEVSREVFDQAHHAITREDWVGWTKRKVDAPDSHTGTQSRVRAMWVRWEYRARRTTNGLVRRMRIAMP